MSCATFLKAVTIWLPSKKLWKANDVRDMGVLIGEICENSRYTIFEFS